MFSRLTDFVVDVAVIVDGIGKLRISLLTSTGRCCRSEHSDEIEAKKTEGD